MSQPGATMKTTTHGTPSGAPVTRKIRMFCAVCGNFEDECGALHIQGYYICKLKLKRPEGAEPAIVQQEITRLCLDCRKVEVAGIKRYCGKCSHKRKLAAT